MGTDSAIKKEDSIEVRQEEMHLIELFPKEVMRDVTLRFGIARGRTSDYVKQVYKNISEKDMQLIKKLREEIRNDHEQLMRVNNEKLSQKYNDEIFKKGMQYLKLLKQNDVCFISYIASEIGIESGMKTYSGGLGVLNGDIHEVATQKEVPFLNFVLFSKFGYGKQIVKGFESTVVPDNWNFMPYPGLYLLTDDKLREFGFPRLDIKVPIQKSRGIKETRVAVYVKFHVGMTGHVNPIFLFTTDIEENSPWQREITDVLYPGSKVKKLYTQYILAKGTMEMIDQLGLNVKTVNINEGHAALVCPIYIQKYLEKAGVAVNSEKNIAQEVLDKAIQSARDLFYFTTHTIVAGAFDIYPRYDHLDGDLHLSSQDILDPDLLSVIDSIQGWDGCGNLNMAILASKFVGAINTVSNVHFKVTVDKIFPQFKTKTENVTNGIYIYKWWPKQLLDILAKPAYKNVIGDYDQDYMRFLNVIKLKNNESFRQAIKTASRQSKTAMIEKLSGWIRFQLADQDEQHITYYEKIVEDLEKIRQDDLFVINTTRRITGYKQNDILDMVKDKILTAANKMPADKKVLFAYSGKSHPKDKEGQGMLRNILEFQKYMYERSGGRVMVAFVHDYDMEKGLYLNHSDLSISASVVGWEASGTSPGKNPLKLIMHTRDGFFPEVMKISELLKIEMGFPFGPEQISENYKEHWIKQSYADALYNALFEGPSAAINIFFSNPEKWVDMQIGSIAVLGCYFNMHRLLDNYIKYWDPQSRCE